MKIPEFSIVQAGLKAVVAVDDLDIIPNLLIQLAHLPRVFSPHSCIEKDIIKKHRHKKMLHSSL